MTRIIPCKEHNYFVDILKGICIVFVVITHYSWGEDAKLKYLFPFWIDMAVPTFMIISGYVYSLSYKRSGIKQIGEAYLLKNTINKLIRYTIPYAIIFIIEELFNMLTGTLSFSLESTFSVGLRFLSGGKGPGSYYYPVMMQFVFVFPIIFFIVKKYESKGVVICGFINAMFELLQRAYGMNEGCYRFLVFRYILLIAVGSYIADNSFRINKRVSVISFIIGIAFIICNCYLGYEPKIIIYWTKTSFIACLYIIPLTMIMISHLKQVRFKPLEVLGKASYNIFLLQLVYYNFIFRRMTLVISNRTLQLFLSLVACLSVGVCFYLVEAPFTKWVNKKIYSILQK